MTTLAAAVARRWPDVRSASVDPRWVPTRMGGPGAPDDLVLGHETQVWLATSDDPAAVSGAHWHHRRTLPPAPAAIAGGAAGVAIDPSQKYFRAFPLHPL